MKPFLILQLRANNAAADGEFKCFLKYGQLSIDDVVRVRMEKNQLPDVNLNDYSAVLIGGGPWNVSDKEKSDQQRKVEVWLADLLSHIIEQDFPLLGACYGMGIITNTLGGRLEKKFAENVEAANIHLTKTAQNDPLFTDLPKNFPAFAGHKESCTALPAQAVLLAKSDTCPHHAFRVKKNIYATQFHPELDIPTICQRIDVYKHAGYFPPEDAEKLKNLARKQKITIPMKILKRFIDRYRY